LFALLYRSGSSSSTVPSIVLGAADTSRRCAPAAVWPLVIHGDDEGARPARLALNLDWKNHRWGFLSGPTAVPSLVDVGG